MPEVRNLQGGGLARPGSRRGLCSAPRAGPVAGLGPLFRSLRVEDFATTARRERATLYSSRQERRLMPTEGLRNISDTALWVAQYRVMESERPDAIFRDPLAKKLVGDRREELVRRMTVRGIAWPMIVRTAVMDEIILRAIDDDGVDCVLNLATGLDTRPYRLPLPRTLRWIEADLPAMLAYKAEKLAGESRACRFESVAADLTDASARKALFARAAEGSRAVLAVTEGLLAYLTEEQVASLSE